MQLHWYARLFSQGHDVACLPVEQELVLPAHLGGLVRVQSHIIMMIVACPRDIGLLGMESQELVRLGNGIFLHQCGCIVDALVQWHDVLPCEL